MSSEYEQRVATLVLLNASFCHDLWVLSWQLQGLLVKWTFCWKRRQLSKCQIRIPQDFPRHQVSSILFILDSGISCQLLLWNVALRRKKYPRTLLLHELCCNGTVNFALISAEKLWLKNKLFCHFSKSEEAYPLPAVCRHCSSHEPNNFHCFNTSCRARPKLQSEFTDLLNVIPTAPISLVLLYQTTPSHFSFLSYQLDILSFDA